MNKHFDKHGSSLFEEEKYDSGKTKRPRDKRDGKKNSGRKNDRDSKSKKTERRHHSDGYKTSQTLDLTVAEGIHQLANDTLPLSSNPAPRTDIDPLIKIDAPELFNSGLQTVYNNFRDVDYQQGLPDEDLVPEATMPDYIQSQLAINFPYGLLNPGLSVASMLNNAGGRQNFENNSGPALHTGYYSLITPQVQLINDQFNKLQALFEANLSYASAPLMSATAVALNDGSPLALTGTGTGTQQTGTINPIFAIHASIKQSMLYLVTRLKMGSLDKYLLEYFANKHVAISSFLMQVRAGMQSLRYRALLDRARDLLNRIPTDVDYVENYSKRILPSRTGNSGYDPILIPQVSMQMPTYQVQPGPNQPTYTLGPDNTGGQTEYNLNDGYTFMAANTNHQADYPTYNATTDEKSAQLNVYFLNGANRNVTLGPRSVDLLNDLQNIMRTYAPGEGQDQMQAEVQTYMNLIIQDLQDLVDDCSRLVAMSTTYVGFGQLTERSNLTSLRLGDGHGDYEVSYHYDGFMGDWIKHPEIRAIQVNDGGVNNTINNAQQYTVQIGVHYEDYDRHLVDGIGMYNVCSSAFFNQIDNDGDGNILGLSPFHLTTNNGQPLTQTPTHLDYTQMHEQALFQVPMSLTFNYVTAYDFRGDAYQFTMQDGDTLQGGVVYDGDQPAYGQQFGTFEQLNVSNCANFTLKYLGVTAYLNGDTLERLNTSDYTSLIPVTVMNPVLQLQEWNLQHLPFVTTLKTDAKKVVNVVA